jgi:hypothetical protein
MDGSGCYQIDPQNDVKASASGWQTALVIPRLWFLCCTAADVVSKGNTVRRAADRATG